MILEPKKIKSFTVSIISQSICHEVMGMDAMILGFQMLHFKPVFSLSSFTFIKRLFSFSPLSAITVVSFAYWSCWYFSRQLIPACDLPSLAFHLIYSAYKLNKQGDNTQPCLLSQFGNRNCTTFHFALIKSKGLYFVNYLLLQYQQWNTCFLFFSQKNHRASTLSSLKFHFL